MEAIPIKQISPGGYNLYGWKETRNTYIILLEMGGVFYSVWANKRLEERIIPLLKQFFIFKQKDGFRYYVFVPRTKTEEYFTIVLKPIENFYSDKYRKFIDFTPTTILHPKYIKITKEIEELEKLENITPENIFLKEIPPTKEKKYKNMSRCRRRRIPNIRVLYNKIQRER